MKAEILRLMEEVHVPGVSVAVVEHGQVTRTAAFGSGITPETVFQAASLSKPVFAYIVLQLVHAGALNLDRSLATYIPWPYVADDDLVARISARHVLSHTTGWPNWRPRGEALRRESMPGERFTYSGEGYVYLQRVVEHITRQSLEQLAQQHVFGPLQMTRSSFRWATSHDATVAPAHDRNSDPLERHMGSTPNAASSLHTTAAEFALFQSACLADRSMFEPQVKVTSRVSWGLGWGLEHSDQGLAFWHWGDNPGYKSFALALRQDGAGVVVMTNGDNGRTLCASVVHRVLGTAHPALEWLARRYEHF